VKSFIRNRRSSICVFVVLVFASLLAFTLRSSQVVAQALPSFASQVLEAETPVEAGAKNLTNTRKEVAKASEAEKSWKKALERVTYDIEYLSSDEMAGRQPGTLGIKLAEDYIVGEYEKIGLKQLDNGSYFQEMEVGRIKSIKKGSASLTLVGPKKQEIELSLGDSYQQLIGREDFDLDVELVFVGYGISADEHNYDDFLGVDVKGKIVVLLRNEPQSDDPDSVFDGVENSRHASGQAKAMAARRAGAAGVLMVNDSSTASDAERDTLILADRFGTMSLPFAQIKRSTLNEILNITPLRHPIGKKITTIDEMEFMIDEKLEPLSQAMTGWSAKFKSSFETNGVKTNNIIGILEGEGPQADETIVIGAHYDHLGDGAYGSRAGGRREIHNGADDNATGVAAVLEIARRLAGREKPPARRLVFICFTAEEMGLLGAFHYVENPIFPLEKTTTMVNFDMIGWLRNNELIVYNWNSAVELSGVLQEANTTSKFELKLPQNPFAGSDHLPFHQKQVPNMFLHTGLTEYYHTPEDDFETIDCEGALRVIDYSENVIDGLCELAVRPTFGAPKPFRLGLMLQGNNEGVLVSEVMEDSAAGRAGLKAGDIIVSAAGEKVSSRREVTRIVRRDEGKSIELKLMRDGEEIKLQVELKDVNP